MRKNDLSVFKMEQEGFKITLKRGSDYQPILTTTTPILHPSAVPQIASSQNSDTAASSGESAAGAKGATLKEITSPMVGTFYSAPTPETPTYVSVGQEVSADSVVCIIEAMKVMNEIKAEISGTVVEIVAENGKPVQFGQVLFRLR